MFVWSLVGGAGFGLVWLVVVFAGGRLSAGGSQKHWLRLWAGSLGFVLLAKAVCRLDAP
jgi:hypothetical protein